MTDGTFLPVPQSDDEPLGAVLRALRLERTGDDDFTGTSLPQLNGRIYGGQVLAQALLAAGATMVGAGGQPRLPHSVHGYFLRPGDLQEPVTFTVERLHDGRSFSTRRTHAIQSGRPILSVISSFQEDQPGLDHAEAAPSVPAPEELPSAVDLFASLDNPVANFLSRTGAFDIRHVAGNVYLRPAPESSGEQALWMKLRAPMPADSGQLLHRAMLAYGCDQVMLEPILRRQTLSWRSRGLNVASLDHAMWWHRPVRVDQWLLYVQESPSAQGGRGLGLAKVFDSDGVLVATIAQEGMVRAAEHSDRQHPPGREESGDWQRPSLR